MLRTILVIVHVIEALLYTLFVFDAESGGLFDWVVVVLGMALLVRFIIIALTFAIARTPWQPISLSAAALASEFVAAVYVFSYAALRTQPAYLTPTHSSARHLPVLFIHGFVCNAGFWRHFIALFRPRWGAPIATLSLEPLHTSIDDYAEQIEQRITELRRESGHDQVLIVAHSMGGLATRHVLRNSAASTHIAGVVTLGTPHGGTRMAHFSWAPNAHQMRPASAWLQQLVDDEQQRTSPPVEALVGTHDNIVAPQENAAFDAATNTYMPGISHLAMALSDPVIEWTLERCERLSAQARAVDE